MTFSQMVHLYTYTFFHKPQPPKRCNPLCGLLEGVWYFAVSIYSEKLEIFSAWFYPALTIPCHAKAAKSTLLDAVEDPSGTFPNFHQNKVLESIEPKSWHEARLTKMMPKPSTQQSVGILYLQSEVILHNTIILQYQRRDGSNRWTPIKACLRSSQGTCTATRATTPANAAAPRAWGWQRVVAFSPSLDVTFCSFGILRFSSRQILTCSWHLLTAAFGHQPWLLWFMAVFSGRSKLSPRPLSSCHFLSHVIGACWKGTSWDVTFFTLETYSRIASISSYINRDAEEFWMTESIDLPKSILFCSGTVQLQSRLGWLGALPTTSVPTTCWEGPVSISFHCSSQDLTAFGMYHHLALHALRFDSFRQMQIVSSSFAELKWTWSGWLSFGKSCAWAFSRHLRLGIPTENLKNSTDTAVSYFVILCPCSSYLN